MADDEDEVGYARPPRRTRFAPGRSGNPSGRPRGPRSLPADLRAELEEAVTLREGDLERTFSRQRAILRRLTEKAIEGDAKATAMVLDLVQRLLGAAPEAESEPEPEAKARLAAKLAEVHERLAAARGGQEGSGEPAPDEPEAGS